MNIIKAAEKFAEKKLDEDRYCHSLRVRNWALKIARQEKASLKIVEIAAILHDVGFSSGTFANHHKISASMATAFLKKMKLKKVDRTRIISCIKTHVSPRELLPKMIEDFKENDFPKPASVEAKCICDADIMELVGPMGLVKILNFALMGLQFSLSKSVDHARWLMKGAAEGFLTKTGRELAGPFIDFQNQFFKLYEQQEKV